MKKSIIAILVASALVLVSGFSFASLNEDQVIDSIKGRYAGEVDGNKFQFVVRSSGAIINLIEGEEIENITMSLQSSSSDVLMNGLPVAHFILSTGSDEDTTDYHILMTVTKDGSTEPKKIHVLSVFSTFNDGPNDYTSFSKDIPLEIKKWDTRSHSFKAL